MFKQIQGFTNPPIWNFLLSEKDFFLYTKDGCLLRGIKKNNILNDIGGLMLFKDESYILAPHQSKINQTLVLKKEEDEHTFFSIPNFRVGVVCEKKNILIGSIFNSNFIREQIFIYDLIKQEKTEISTLNEMQINRHIAFYCFDDILIVSGRSRGVNSKYQLIFYDLSENKLISVMEEELSYLIIDAPGGFGLRFIHYDKGILYASYSGNPLKSPGRLLAIDIKKKTVKNILIDTFSCDHLVNGYGGRAGQDPVFRPHDFRYDAAENNLISLGGKALLSYNLDTQTGKTEEFTEEFDRFDLLPNHSSCLHKDHFFFFSSQLIDRYNDDRALGAFNIRTGKLEWHYRFPADYKTVSIGPPKANDRYLLMKDAENRLFVFEKNCFL